MKLTCARDSLLNAIHIVSKAVSSRTTLPILECILLKADENGFKLVANDLEMGIESAPIDAEIDKNGVIALEAKIFSEIIRKVNGETVSFDAKENHSVCISCGSSEFRIMGQPGDDFPSLPEVEKNHAFCMKQNELKNMIRQTIFSIATDDSKPVLTGELIEVNGEVISIVSVDGYRISYKKACLAQSEDTLSAIVPGKTLGEISKILSAEDDDVWIYFTDKHILFDVSGSLVVSRLIEGDYIKYEQSFTEDYKTKVLISRAELVSSLERASLISRDAKKTPVKLDINSSQVIITSNTEMGTAYEEIPADIEGEGLKIAFNPRYLIEALRVIEDEKVSLQFTTSLSPCIIKPVETDEYKYLILPLRM